MDAPVFEPAMWESAMERRNTHRKWVGRHGWRDLQWKCADGRVMRVIDMTPDHARHAAAMMLRQSPRIARQIQKQRHLFWFIFGRADPDDWEDEGPTFKKPNLNPDEHEALRIVRRLPIYKALVLRSTLCLRDIR